MKRKLVALLLLPVLVVTLVGAGLVGSGCAAPAPAPSPGAPAAVEPEYEWNLPFTTPVEAPHGESHLLFADLVNLYSDGRIKLTPYPGGSLGSLIEVTEAVNRGDMEMGFSYPYGSIHPLFDIFLMPYMISSYREADLMAYEGGIILRIFEDIWESLGAKQLFQTSGGFRGISNSKLPILSPADLAGMKVRAMPTPLAIATVDGLGALATPVNWDEVYSAAEKGVVDGIDVALIDFYDYRFYEVNTYYSLLYHQIDLNSTNINLEVWNSLPADLQEAIWKAAKQAEHFSKDISQMQALGLAKELEALGVDFIDATPEMKAAFIENMNPEEIWEMMRPLVDDFYPGQNMLDQIIAEVARMRGG